MQKSAQECGAMPWDAAILQQVERKREKPHALTEASACRRTMKAKRREISHIPRPTHSQERKRKKKSACSVRKDGAGRTDVKTTDGWILS